MFSCLVETRSRFSPLTNHSGKDFFADILSKVLQTSQARDALLVLRNSLLDGQADEVLDKIFAATSRRVPTLYVNADQTEPSQVSFCGMSRDLVVYIYVSEREPDIVEGELIVEDMKRFIHDRVRPKVLVLMILRRPCRNLVTLFRAMWSKNILDAIVVEYYGLSEYSDEYSTIVHRYNPFTDSHNDEPYSVDAVWFTDDFPNMRGYPLVYAFSRRPPYSDIVTSATEEKLKGIDKILIDILADKMNFTKVPKIITEYNAYFKSMSNGTLYGILPDIASRKYDALLVTFPIWGHVYKGMSLAIQHTYPLFIENWCFVVPKLLVKKNFMNDNAFRLFVLNFSIVGIFWLCSRLMKFNPKWHLVKIVGIILAASFPPVLTKLHERIILLSICAVYACYSSTLFAELTSISLKNNRYVQYDSLQDLMNSDLVLMMDANLLAIITYYNSAFKREVYKSDKKIVSFAYTEVCLKDLLMYQNVTCFMEENWAQLFAVNNMRNNETMLKTTKLCYSSPQAANVFPEGSPYIRRVSHLLLMLTEGGIRNKWYREYLWNETRETTIQINRNQTNSMYVNIYHPLIYILITGYSISTLVFIGELIWKYFNINLNLF